MGCKKRDGQRVKSLREPWDNINQHTVRFQGAGDKPRSGQSRRFRHLCEVRHQLSDGDGQRAAYATVAVPGATVWHYRGNILHDRQVWDHLHSFFFSFFFL